MTRKLIAMAAIALALTGCATHEQTGALGGGVGGALIGNAVGGTGGALIGGALGGIGGAAIGNNTDRRQEQRRYEEQNQRQYEQRRPRQYRNCNGHGYGGSGQYC